MRPRPGKSLIYGDCLPEKSILLRRFGIAARAASQQAGQATSAAVLSRPPHGASLVQFRALGTSKGFFCAGVQRADTALHRQKRRITIPRVRTGKVSAAEVVYPPLHLEHVGGRESFEPVAFDGMSGIPLLTQYRSVGRGNVNGARVPDDLQIDLVAIASVHVHLDVGEASSAEL